MQTVGTASKSLGISSRMKQSNQSLEEISQTVGMWIDWLKKEQKNNQAQLKQLENMNESFSKSLNDSLTYTSVKLTSQLKKDVDTAIKANIQAMENTIRASVFDCS